MHDVDDKNGNVTKRGSSVAKIGKRFVTRCVDDQETGYFQIVGKLKLRKLNDQFLGFAVPQKT